ncbi:MAG: YraN family protein [Paludibacter sp.]|jgi:putative endonuclease
MADHNELGEKGEELARLHLIDNGYKIRETKWRTGSLELDIIAEKDDTLVIVEVKTRSGAFADNPEQYIDNRKIRNIVNATERYIMRYDWNGDTRFDVIAVIIDGSKSSVEHIEDAFLAPGR